MTTKTILCFGDSLTWGWIPVEEGAPTRRYKLEERWTGAMAAALGPDYRVIEEGLSARTTSVEDPNDPRLNGADALPMLLASHLPLDLVVIMLGTNDTKAFFRRTPFEIAYGMGKLVGIAATSAYGVGTAYPAPGILVVAPPPLGTMPHPFMASLFEGAEEKSAALAAHYAALADFAKVGFFDAGSVVSTDGCDGVHLTADSNLTLGKALAQKVTSLV